VAQQQSRNVQDPTQLQAYELMQLKKKPMNARSNPSAVILGMIAIEGMQWFKDQQEWENSGFDAALAKANKPEGYENGIVYGFGGLHRYSIDRETGNVRFIANKCSRPEKLQLAKDIGFEII
jgi:hypothetical protein